MEFQVNYLGKTVLILSCVGLISCSAVPVVTQQTQPTGATSQAIHSATTKSLVCVVHPGDQAHGQEKYPGSGAEIGQRVEKAVQQAGWQTVAIKVDAGQSAAECTRRGGTHLLETRVTHYEDNLTGWTLNPDRIELQLRLSPASQPAQVRQVSYEARSNLLASAIVEWGNAKPVSLLKGDFDSLVSRLLSDAR
ncbi:hypothetical protein B9Z49_01390 [Limnohabitans sp. 2KL-51]|nr:hypothetical protein B9Z49_01390 [Limnohabitans sp. 2KL-51]